MKKSPSVSTHLAASGVLLLAAASHAQHSDIAIWSTASGGGQLVARIDNTRVRIFRNVCAGGRCLYSATDPGFLTPAQGSAPPGLFPVAAGTRISMVIVAIDPGVTVRLGDTRLDRPGAAGFLGTAPDVHIHPSWQVLTDENTIADFNVAFRLTAATSHGESEPLVVTLTNDDAPPTATPAIEPHPAASATPTLAPEPPPLTSTATATASPEPTPTSPPDPRSCPGDCNGDGVITVDEIVIGINVALGNRKASACPAFDIDASGTVTVDELVTAITVALSGCQRTGE